MKKSSASTSLLCVLLILCFSFALCAEIPTYCNPQDHITLQKISAALGFNPDEPGASYAGFVVCDSHPPYPVIELNFVDDYSSVSGQIPAAVADLKSLSQLSFISQSNLTGNIPLAITNLPLLSTIIISQTGLSGPVPTFLTRVKKLSHLDLSYNSFTGSIPPELAQSPKLNFLNLSGNKLTGTIPESFGDFKSADFRTLDLSNNFLTGTVPKSLGNLNLQVIGLGSNYLSGNYFSGDLSFLFGKNKTNLKDLYIGYNNFSFDLSNVEIPPNVEQLILNDNNLSFNLSNVEFPPNLEQLDLSYNNIFGSLPTQLTQLNLVSIDVSNNQLCGEIPQGGKLQTFEIRYYANNKCLCGSPLPACK